MMMAVKRRLLMTLMGSAWWPKSCKAILFSSSSSSGGSESPANTSVFVAGTTINASPTPGSAGSGNLIAFTSGGGITVNGSTVGSATTAIAIYYANDHSCYWVDSANVWTGPITSSSLGSTITGVPPGAGGQVPPSQAILAGFYTKNTSASDDFTSTTVAPAGTYTGYKWYLCASGATSANWSINTAGTATGNLASPNGGLLALTGTFSNSGGQGILQTVPLGHTLASNAYSHGYYEIYAKLDPTAQNTGLGWSGFWSWSYEDVSTNNGATTILEMDFMEYYSNNGTAATAASQWHSWSRSGGFHAIASGPQNFTSTMNANYRSWGFLWTGDGTTGTLATFLDNVQFGATAATGLTANSAPCFLEDSGEQRVVILSAGQSTFTIDYFNLWQ